MTLAFLGSLAINGQSHGVVDACRDFATPTWTMPEPLDAGDLRLFDVIAVDVFGPWWSALTPECAVGIRVAALTNP